MIEKYQFIDLIIRRDALEQSEKGLSEKIIKEYKVDDKHYDENLICIRAGMNYMDVEYEIEKFVKTYGLRFNYDNGNNPTDIVIVEPLRGIITKNNWLENNGERFPHTKYFMKEIIGQKIKNKYD